MDNTKNNVQETYSLELTQGEINLLVSILKSVPLQGNLDQVDQIISQLKDLLDKLNGLSAPSNTISEKDK